MNIYIAIEVLSYLLVLIITVPTYKEITDREAPNGFVLSVFHR